MRTLHSAVTWTAPTRRGCRGHTPPAPDPSRRGLVAERRVVQVNACALFATLMGLNTERLCRILIIAVEVDLVVVIRQVGVEGVACLSSEKPLHEAKNAQVEWLCKVRRMGGDKKEGDVFGCEQLGVGCHFVGRASVEEQDGTVIKKTDGFAQRPARFFNVGDEYIVQPIPKNITNDEAVLGRIEADFLLVISAFKNTRTDRSRLRDDCWHERRPVESDTHDEGASI